MKELIGKNISGLSINDGETILVFYHPDETYTAYEADGDCCSETWFADIVGVDALIGQTVNTAEPIDVPEIEDGRCRQEFDSFYGYKLTTDKGYVDIVYRNSSNGYYGGSIFMLRGNPPKILTPIIDDWRA